MDHLRIKPSCVLHWNYKGLTEFPFNQIRGEESEITDIYLKENLISRLPNDICMLESLESLYLSGNDITALPREISKLRCLKCLDVSGNRLRYIPDEIGEARSLKFLILDENELTELPPRLAELQGLRYLSVCDNRLKYLPQRPVYNYYHCELRFWRNPDLRTLPYSLWYHMFRDQQTRSLNIGCLAVTNAQNLTQYGPRCRLKLKLDSTEMELDVKVQPKYNIILESHQCTPPSLYELCRRTFYQMLTDTAKKLSYKSSLYSDIVYDNSEANNNLIHSFEDFNVSNEEINTAHPEDHRRYTDLKCTKAKHSKTQYAPSDFLTEYFNFLPNFMITNLCNGPVSRCENADCKKAIFDYVYCEFCFGKIILIDSTTDVILSAAFCSKNCADIWRLGKTNLIPWKLIND